MTVWQRKPAQQRTIIRASHPARVYTPLSICRRFFGHIPLHGRRLSLEVQKHRILFNKKSETQEQLNVFVKSQPIRSYKTSTHSRRISTRASFLLSPPRPPPRRHKQTLAVAPLCHSPIRYCTMRKRLPLRKNTPTTAL